MRSSPRNRICSAEAVPEAAAMVASGVVGGAGAWVAGARIAKRFAPASKVESFIRQDRATPEGTGA